MLSCISQLTHIIGLTLLLFETSYMRLANWRDPDSARLSYGKWASLSVSTWGKMCFQALQHDDVIPQVAHSVASKSIERCEAKKHSSANSKQEELQERPMFATRLHIPESRDLSASQRNRFEVRWELSIIHTRKKVHVHLLNRIWSKLTVKLVLTQSPLWKTLTSSHFNKSINWLSWRKRNIWNNIK